MGTYGFEEFYDTFGGFPDRDEYVHQLDEADEYRAEMRAEFPRRGQFDTFTCVRCGWEAYVRVLPETRFDPACLETDPPEECARCGGDMGDVS